MTKGAETRRVILDHALDLSSEVGLEGLTIGVLAKLAGMSKSGLYAHFASKEDLQIAVLDVARERWIDDVMAPAIKAPRGIPRIQELFERWVRWGTVEMTGGCPFVAATTEFDDRPGPVRDRLVQHLRDVLDAMERAAEIAIAEGDFRDDVDAAQFAYEMWGNVVAFHGYYRLLREEDAIVRARAALDALIDRASPRGAHP